MKFYVKETPTSNPLTSALAVAKEFNSLKSADQESVWIVGLDAASKTIFKECVFLGGINCSVVDPKLIFRRLLGVGAISFICVHNHPGGQILPSKEDNLSTKKLREIGKIIDLNLLDHIIIAGDGYYSYKENGIL